jgi:hypothetical protein
MTPADLYDLSLILIAWGTALASLFQLVYRRPRC